MKIAVTGATGQLGSELVKQGCFPLRGRLMSEEMTRTIETIRPDIIINCAAMTNVDACEQEPLLAAATNTAAVEYLSYRFPGYLVQISTDYVFDGKNGPYGVHDAPNPINLYGWSKLGGELMIRRHRGPWLVVRTTILFSSANNNFVAKIVKQLREGKTVHLYTPNLLGTPTYVPALAAEILRMVEAEYTGVAHVVGENFITRHLFTEWIAKAFGYNPELIVQMEGSLPGATRPMRAGLIPQHSGREIVQTHNPIDGLKELAAQYRKGEIWK
jgi:dTDP-4-dehydrorhamnose reductase